MADVNRGNRPLSPHLEIYRPQWTSISSILVRITGNAIILAALLIVWWFVAAATGPAAFAIANGFITSWFGDLIMFFSVLGLWYHMLGGLRHLVWDSGRMLDVDKSELAAQMMMVLTVLLTIFTVVVL
ncbi:succinate dehydrogenase, cytochrome b556 subunit [Yoonia sp.]|uniref:succinate dehydrogenase, cytochrome b556 subunit n=1 Tax=Yoonia sp. TaxID=2212373 RepID=UPI0023B689F6